MKTHYKAAMIIKSAKVDFLPGNICVASVCADAGCKLPIVYAQNKKLNPLR